MGLTQKELARMVDLEQQTIQQIESGKIKQTGKIEEIAKAVQRSPAWLQFGVEEIDRLDSDAITLAQSWMKLSEPERSAMFAAITEMAKKHKR